MNDIGKPPRIPLVDALRVKIIGRALSPLPPMVSRIAMSATPRDVTKNDCQYLASVDIRFEQIAPNKAEEHVRRNAVVSICRHVYGPVIEELMDITDDLWKVGVPADSPAMQRIDRLLRVLSGDEVL